MTSTGGFEWVVEAHGCEPAALASTDTLQAVFAAIIDDLQLHPIETPLWHKFPAPGGVTGLIMLRESHLACHSFPEHRSICLNLFCCRARPDWDFERELSTRLGARHVQVRRIERPYSE